jgi:flagellar biogenesis protein FliO
MFRPDMYTGIVLAILFVIGLGLGIVKLSQKRRRKMASYLNNDYRGSYGKYIH